MKHINLEVKDIKQIHKKINNIIIPQPEGLDEWRAEDSIQSQKAAFQSGDTGRAWQRLLTRRQGGDIGRDLDTINTNNTESNVERVETNLTHHITMWCLAPGAKCLKLCVYSGIQICVHTKQETCKCGLFIRFIKAHVRLFPHVFSSYISITLKLYAWEQAVWPSPQSARRSAWKTESTILQTVNLK